MNIDTENWIWNKDKNARNINPFVFGGNGNGFRFGHSKLHHPRWFYLVCFFCLTPISPRPQRLAPNKDSCSNSGYGCPAAVDPFTHFSVKLDSGQNKLGQIMCGRRGCPRWHDSRFARQLVALSPTVSHKNSTWSGETSSEFTRTKGERTRSRIRGGRTPGQAIIGLSALKSVSMSAFHCNQILLATPRWNNVRTLWYGIYGYSLVPTIIVNVF